MIPNLDHLFWLRHDHERFETERSRIISDYISTLPEKHRSSAHAMQRKIDEARARLSDEELLQWMVHEAGELAANLDDLFLHIRHSADGVRRQLDAPPDK